MVALRTTQLQLRRESTMRYTIIAFSLFLAACGDMPFRAPTGPSGNPTGAAEATRGSALPMSGTLDATETVAGADHELTGTGESTHLGRFALHSEFVVVPAPASTATGTATWTAADGSTLVTTLTGQATVTFPTAAIHETHTVTGGTGRFAAASGTLVVERMLNLLTLASSGSVSGTLSLGL
jgi:hypothetical protein